MSGSLFQNKFVIRKILNNNSIFNSSPANSVVSAAFVITIAGLASRILGLFRDRLLASAFGAGDVMDVYYAAFKVPDLIYNVLILGALGAAFIPIFTGLINEKNKEAAWELANGILNIMLLLLIIFSLIFAIFAPFVMKVITPGFSPEKMDQVVSFSRIMFLSPVFLGLSGIFGGILTSFRKFLIYSIAPIMYNLGIIFGVLVLVRFWGPIGLAWGVVLGASLHMLIQLPAAWHSGFRYKPIFKKAFFNPNIRKVFFLMIPRALGIAINQINILVITIFASTLAAGSLAVFSFAQNIQSVPLGIFGISFAIAVFPVLSTLAAKNKTQDFIENFSTTFRQILFFVVPLSIFLIVLRAQVVRVVLGSGKFDWSDTILTFQCLGVFAASLFAQSTIPLLARSFYALQNTKTPFFIALIIESINILLVFLLIGKYQVLGLAIAFSTTSIIQMFLLLFFLHFKLGNLNDKKIIKFLFKISIASVLAGGLIQLLKNYLVNDISISLFGQKILRIVSPSIDLDTFLGVFAQLSISGLFGLGAFIALCWLLRLEEFFNFKDSLARKLFKGKKVIVENTTEVSGI